MKSKSPFAMKSPLLAYKSDMKGNYANPEYVPETIVGAEIGANIAKTAASVFDSYANSKKSAQSDSKKAFDDLANTKSTKFDYNRITDFTLPGAATIISGSDLNRRTEVLEKQGGGGFSGQSAKDLLGRNLTNKESKWKDDEVKRLGGVQQYRDQYKIGEEKDKFHTKTTNEYEDDKKISSRTENLLDPISMKGSPNKLIGDTMNINPGAVPPNQAQNDLGAQPIISADGSQPNARAIDIAAIANPYATPGADFNPQSKMKAESIFGSPMQRQGLMNLGTPLHDAGHGTKQSHSHPSKTTTKMKPDGEYPGAKYVKGDLVDQDDLLDKTKLDAHIATQVQSDKKGTFIKEKSDDGPGSDIETSKGFGKKIRLGSMGRSSYTSNMKDQLDPNDFLFKNTPKK
jgi:hypothetical protein